MSQTGKTGRLCGLLACWILAAACGGAAGSAAGSRSSETAASQAASIEWEQTVAAARREGKIAIVGPQGSDIPADHVLPV